MHMLQPTVVLTVSDECHSEPATLVRNSAGSDFVMVASDPNAQVGKPSASEICLGRRCVLPTESIDDEDRLLHLCTDNRLFLSGKNFRHSSRGTMTWGSNSIVNLGRMDHITVSCRWRGSLQNCWSYWPDYAESDGVLVVRWFSLHLKDHQRKPSTRLAIHHPSDSDVWISYRHELSDILAPSSL